MQPMEKYYLHLANEQKGPFTIGQLQAMWLAGTIDRNTQFYTKANGDWKKLEAILELLEADPASAENPHASVPPTDAAASIPMANPSAVSASVPSPRAPAGLGRCPECCGLGGHLTECPQAGQAPAVAPAPGTKATAPAQPPTPQQWRERMAEAAQTPGSESSRMVHQSFPILNFFSSLMRGLGWIVFIIGALWVLVSLVTTHGDSILGLLMNLMPAIGVMALGLLFIVLGEVIGVIFSIEKNTFKAAASLDIIARNLRARNSR